MSGGDGRDSRGGPTGGVNGGPTGLGGSSKGNGGSADGYMDSNGEMHILITNGREKNKTTGNGNSGGNENGNGSSSGSSGTSITVDGGITLSSTNKVVFHKKGPAPIGYDQIYTLVDNEYVSRAEVDENGKVVGYEEIVHPKNPKKRSSWSARRDTALNQINAYQKKKKEAEEKAKAEADKVKDAVKATADFYKELYEKQGEKASQLAKEMADAVKGKKIRNVNDALKAFEKHMDVINKKYSVKDRQAIAKALASLNRQELAKNYSKFSKAFQYVGNTVDAFDTAMALKDAIETNSWRSFFVKVESLAAGRLATGVTAFAFSIIRGTPLGILGYAIVMTLVGALVDDKLMEKVNQRLGI